MTISTDALFIELQRCPRLLKPSTTLDDGVTALGWDADPNTVVNGRSPGETLICACSMGTSYVQGDGTFWDKKSAPNVWLQRGAGGGGGGAGSVGTYNSAFDLGGFPTPLQAKILGRSLDITDPNETDCSPYLAAAITYCLVHGITVLVIPPGVYLLMAALNLSNIADLIILAEGAHFLIHPGFAVTTNWYDLPGALKWMSSDLPTFIKCDGGQRIRIVGATFDSNWSNAPLSVFNNHTWITNSAHVVFERCYFLRIKSQYTFGVGCSYCGYIDCDGDYDAFGTTVNHFIFPISKPNSGLDDILVKGVISAGWNFETATKVEVRVASVGPGGDTYEWRYCLGLADGSGFAAWSGWQTARAMPSLTQQQIDWYATDIPYQDTFVLNPAPQPLLLSNGDPLLPNNCWQGDGTQITGPTISVAFASTTGHTVGQTWSFMWAETRPAAWVFCSDTAGQFDDSNYRNFIINCRFYNLPPFELTSLFISGQKEFLVHGCDLATMGNSYCEGFRLLDTVVGYTEWGVMKNFQAKGNTFKYKNFMLSNIGMFFYTTLGTFTNTLHDGLDITDNTFVYLGEMLPYEGLMCGIKIHGEGGPVSNLRIRDNTFIFKATDRVSYGIWSQSLTSVGGYLDVADNTVIGQGVCYNDAFYGLVEARDQETSYNRGTTFNGTFALTNFPQETAAFTLVAADTIAGLKELRRGQHVTLLACGNGANNNQTFKVMGMIGSGTGYRGIICRGAITGSPDTCTSFSVVTEGVSGLDTVLDPGGNGVFIGRPSPSGNVHIDGSGDFAGMVYPAATTVYKDDSRDYPGGFAMQTAWVDNGGGAYSLSMSTSALYQAADSSDIGTLTAYGQYAFLSGYLGTRSSFTVFRHTLFPNGERTGLVDYEYGLSVPELVIGWTHTKTYTQSLTIAKGTISITLDAGLGLTPDTVIAHGAIRIVRWNNNAYDYANAMYGKILSYDNTTGVASVKVYKIKGAGTYSSWGIIIGDDALDAKSINSTGANTPGSHAGYFHFGGNVRVDGTIDVNLLTINGQPVSTSDANAFHSNASNEFSSLTQVVPSGSDNGVLERYVDGNAKRRFLISDLLSQVVNGGYIYGYTYVSASNLQTIESASKGRLFLLNTGSEARIQTLNNGDFFFFKNVSSGNATISLFYSICGLEKPDGTLLANGYPSFTLKPGAAVCLYCYGGNYYCAAIGPHAVADHTDYTAPTFPYTPTAIMRKGLDVILAYLNKAVTGAVSAGGLVKLTVVGHGRSTGHYVFNQNIGGTTEANGFWKITVVDADHYTLDGSLFVNAYTSGGTSCCSFIQVVAFDNSYTNDGNKFTASTAGGYIQVAAGGLYKVTVSSHVYWYNGNASHEDQMAVWMHILRNENSVPLLSRYYQQQSKVVNPATFNSVLYNDVCFDANIANEVIQLNQNDRVYVGWTNIGLSAGASSCAYPQNVNLTLERVG